MYEEVQFIFLFNLRKEKRLLFLLCNERFKKELLIIIVLLFHFFYENYLAK